MGPAPPYVPRKTDYAVDLGLMSSKDDLFWSGVLMGYHIGECPFIDSTTCQWYLDGIIGVAAREAETQGHLWVSPRWQYVNFPDRYSTFWRLILGAANIARPENRGYQGVAGVGVGVVNYLHDKVDVHVEGRFVATDRLYGQAVLGVNIKVDRLLEYFAHRLKDLGVGTVRTAIEATGTAIEATEEGLGGIVEGVSTAVEKAKSKKSKKQKESAPVPAETPQPK